jgi:hypothetical protein
MVDITTTLNRMCRGRGIWTMKNKSKAVVPASCVATAVEDANKKQQGIE